MCRVMPCLPSGFRSGPDLYAAVRSLSAEHWTSAGDLTFEVGFVLAAAIYYLTFSLQPGPKDEVLILPDTEAAAGQTGPADPVGPAR